MGRSPCCDESGLKKGPWTPEEDQKLVNISRNKAMEAGEPSPNLQELMEHQSWEEHAVRLQAEAAQMARLQYLQYLLQSPASVGVCLK
ncbi:hypothetical protein CK203_113359 [Vitis vinifera]|uniref:Myb-like domain-containing protein n=1 Tax=Vitis vinifera TaxID=29760 RepID=A0A438C986_VITVI|nr:hypothetical protein CK203_113359 [Vitis vinifera]